MIQVGDLIQLKTSENRSISMRRRWHLGAGYRKEISYTPDHPPVLVLKRFKMNNRVMRPYRVKVLHNTQTWEFRFSYNDSLEKFFKKVNP